MLRQLVELQLCHCQEIKLRIDRAWGVIHNKHKKMEMTSAPPPPDDPHSRENLQLIPLGQDCQRKRYWVIDGPCILLSSPVDMLFGCICRESYIVRQIAVLSRFQRFVFKYIANIMSTFLSRFDSRLPLHQSMENHRNLSSCDLQQGRICGANRKAERLRPVRAQSWRKAKQNRCRPLDAGESP